jgi:dolichyl-phosphate-mannose-protein mannosyltransferase
MPGDRFAGWFGPIVVTLIAAVPRFWHLTQPRGIYFDEVYYTKDAYSLLTHGYELNTTCDGPGFVAHPPLGKWFMAVSEWLFGYTTCGGVRHGAPELGWRAASALVGTLAVLVFARAARRMFRSTILGCFAGLLLALDGLEFVQSRIGILDIFLMFGLIVALACLVLDRDDGRRRLADRLERAGPLGPDGSVAPGPGPRLGFRWWRLACGVALGLSMGVKWSALWTIIGFAALALAWDVGARRTAGTTHPFRAYLRRDLLGWAPAFLVVPALAYSATWTGWFATSGGFNRHRYGKGVVATLHSWYDYQHQMLEFHDHLSTPHPYASKPLSWLILGRPVAYYYSSPTFGHSGCTARAGCSREVLAIGNPAIWWCGTLAIVGVFALWVARRDWRAALAVVGFLTGFLPWLLFPSRTMFLFYALPLLPFMIIALTSLAGLAIGPSDASDARRLGGALTVGLYTIIVALLFVYFYPILAAQVIPTSAWRARMWFPGWI